MTIGIYKITSPTDKVYIGQSINIERRWKYNYSNNNLTQCKRQRVLHFSLKKYGYEKHIFEIIHVLSPNTDKKEIIKKLNELEEFYIKKFNSFIDDNPLGMNLTRGGGNRVQSKETIIKSIISRTGLKRSQETKDKISKAHLGRNKSREAVIKSANSKRGKPHSEEAKLKISLATKGENNPMYGKSGIESPNFGIKLSPETLAKLSGDNHWTRKKEISLETRKKQSIARKGIKLSPETIAKMKLNRPSQESLRKREETKRLIREEKRMMIF